MSSPVPTATVPTVPSASQASSLAGGKSLNVKDALSYLDQVKSQFNDNPDVYNKFLDIMKEFKSQNIDTQAVIGRVSTLFKGHPSLIMGFNTFLPPGYRIESAGGDGPPTLTLPPGAVINTAAFPSAASEAPNPAPGFHTSSMAGYGYNALRPLGPAPPLPAPIPGSSSDPSGSTRRQPVEFKNAINYVNKIKQRFANDPETYKSFLDILQTYQRETRSVKEMTKIHAQVAHLFRNDTDLLYEFSQFLPDTSGGMAPSPAAIAAKNMGLKDDGMSGIRPPPMGGFSPAPDDVYAQSSKRSSLGGKGARGSSKRPVAVAQPTMAHMPPKKKFKGKESDAYPSNSLLAAPGVGSRSARHRVSAHQDEIDFFDRVKRSLPSTVYAEFLKCLHLFSQEVLTPQDLLQLVPNFLGKHPDLYKWFQKFLGVNETSEETSTKVTYQPLLDGGIDQAILQRCKRVGPSYRLLPPEFRNHRCSGRSPLCTEVLNDEYYSFPQWSEDTVFQSSKKNPHEEVLFRCEDERYDLDMIIEANLSTIRLLEPLAKRLATLPPDEQIRLPIVPSFGGQSDVIPLRAIRKVYGDRASEVMDGLKKYPAVAVPIVLSRLKQKDEEWRRAQREWNKIWRDTHAKNYYRALDYQGAFLKQAEKKAKPERLFLGEAEQASAERRAGEKLGTTSRKHDTECSLRDLSVLKDVMDVIIAHCEKVPQATAEKAKVLNLLADVLHHFFGLENSAASIANAPSTDVILGNTADTNGSTDVISKEEETAAAEVGSEKREEETSSGSVEAASASIALTTGTSSLHTIVPNAALSAALAGPLVFKSTGKPVLYGNLHFYLIFRFLSTLFLRFEKIKIASVEAEANREKYSMSSTIAEGLELHPKIAGLQSEPQADYYQSTIELCRKLVQNDLDVNLFEDQMRVWYGTEAYHLFYMERYIVNLVKNVTYIVTHRESAQLFDIFKEEGSTLDNEGESSEKEAEYRTKIQGMSHDEYLFRIHYDRLEHFLTFTLLERAHPKNATEQTVSGEVAENSGQENSQQESGGQVPIADDGKLDQTASNEVTMEVDAIVDRADESWNQDPDSNRPDLASETDIAPQ